MSLLNREWQVVNGTAHVRIFPFIRKPDIISSNTFLLETAEQIIVIDPGADDDNTREIEQMIRELYRDKNRPVLIFLTHCHVDHALHVTRYLAMRNRIPVWTAVHHDAVEAVTTGDRKSTVAELYHLEFPCFNPDISLFPPHVREIHTESREIVLSDGVGIAVETVCLKTTGDAPFYKKSLFLGAGDIMEWYCTPGHSPDSICIKIGDILFTGDILVATNPVINAVSGWSRRDYINSVANLIWLLEQGSIAWCCLGHGGMIPGSQILEMMKKLRSKAEKMGDDTVTFNADRLRYATEYASEVLVEAEEVFSTIAGRLYYLAHYLEILEEDDLAGEFRQSFEADKIDECLLNLRLLADDYSAGRKLEIDFALRALDVIKKIQNLFNSNKLSAVIPRNLLNRANLLLLDFVNAAQGVRNPEDVVLVDINRFLEDFILEAGKSPHTDLDIFDAVENKEQFLAHLAARIAHVPLLETMEITFSPCPDLPLIEVVASRFGDTLTDLLCGLGGEERQELHIAVAHIKAHVEIDLECPGKNIRTCVGESKWNSFTRRFRMCGFEMSMQGERLNLRSSQ